jgi:dephospho-CoA kinase
VFEDPTLLRKLERLLHPHVHAAIRKAIAEHRTGKGAAVLVIDAPLLIEVGLDRDCDVLWYVDVPEELRLARAERRGMTSEELRRRESFQTPRARKRARADRIIQNDVDDGALDAQIREGLQALGVWTPEPNPHPQEPGKQEDTN